MVSETKTVRCGVIGAGWWATSAHIPAILRHSSATLVAVQTQERDTGQRIARQFSVPHVLPTAEQLLAIDDLDAVVVSTPPHMHYANAKASLQRGLHVLVEKPMTIRSAQADELVQIAQERNLQLLVSCPWHYTRHAIQTRQLCQNGDVGEIKMISMLMTNPVSRLIKGIDVIPTHGGPAYIHPRPGSYSDPGIAGGGQVYTQVSHAAAYVCYITGQRPTEVFARFDNDHSINDIYDVLSIAMDQGTIVSLASTGATPFSTRHFEVRVYGTKLLVVLDLWLGRMDVFDIEADRQRKIEELRREEIYPEGAPATNLVDCILGATANLSPGYLGADAIRIIETACESAATGRNLSCEPIIPRDPLPGPCV